MDHHSVPCSSTAEERGGGGRRVGTEEHQQQHGQVINKLANAVMMKLANSDPSKTLTPNHVNHIKQCLSGYYPVIHTPDHPTYSVMIQRAVNELNEEGGSTEEAISKFIREQFDCLPLAHERLLSHHLKKLCESREIVNASKNCYMLPSEKNDSVSQRERVQKRKGRGERGRGRRVGTGVRHKKLAVQVEVTEQQREHAQQNQEPNQDLYSEVIEDQNGFPVLQNEQDAVNGLQSRTQMLDVAMIVENQNNAKEKYKGNEQQIEVTEQKLGQQSQQPSLPEWHSKVIDDQIGSPEEQQDEVNGQRSRKQMQEVDVIVEKQDNSKQKFKEIEEVGMAEQQREHGQQSQEPNQEQCNKVIDDKNGSPEQHNEQPDEVNGQKSQSHMQEVAKTVEEENSAKLKDKVAEEQVEVNEQQRLHGEQSQEPSLQEQHIKVMDNQCGSPDEQKDEVNGQKSENKMQEVAVIVGQQSNSEQKFEANEGQAEVTEHRKERIEEISLEEQEQYQVVIDRNGSPDKQKDEINGEQSQTQMQEVTVLVGKQRIAEHIYKVTEDEQVEVTEQQREDWQQSQEPTQEEQHCKVIDYQSGSPEQQNEQLDEANGQQSRKQMQETAVIFENQINAEQNYIMTEEKIQAREDEIIEGQCQTEEQGCSVTREPLQIEGIDREIQLLEEQVEMIEKLATPGQKIEMISEPNKPPEKIESIPTIYDSRNLQELLSKKQDKDAAIAINSSPSLSSQNWPHHGSTLWSEENCVELLMRTRKLGEKLLENLSSIRQGSNNSSQKPIKDLEETLVPITSPCGETEDIVCGSPERQKQKSETSAQREAFVSQPIEMSSSLETPMDLFSKHGKLANHGSQLHMPKCQKKSIKTFPDVELPPQQEIGNLERSLELLMMEGDNSGEVSRLVGKGTCLNFEANHEEEKRLEVQNADYHPNLCSLKKPSISLLVESSQDVSMNSPEHELERKLENQQPKLQKTERLQDVKLQSVEGGHKAQQSEPSISSFDLFQASQEPDPELPIQEKFQELKQCMQSFGQEKQQQTSVFGGVKASDGQLATDEEQQAESVIKENAVESDLTESKHSCQKQQEKQEQRQQRQLRPRHKKPSECGLQDEEQQAESVINENSVEIELTESEHSSQKQQEKPEQRQQRQLLHWRQKPSESDSGVPKAPKFQLRENQIEENSKELETETPDQSCQTQHQALGQQEQRQLRRRGEKSDCGNQKDGEVQQAAKVTEQSCQARHETLEQQQLRGLGPKDQRPSNSDLQLENAPVCQEIEHDQQPRERIQETGVKLEHSAVKMSCQEQQNTKEPTQRRQLRPRGQSQSKSEVSITTSPVESPPKRHQDTLIPNLQEAETPQDAKTGDTQQQRQLRSRVKKLSDSGQDTLKLNLQEAEKPQDLNTSAAKTGKTQQQRQLRPRVKKLSDSGQAPSGSREVLSPSQSLDELSNSGRSQMQNPGVEDSSQLKNEHKNNCNRLKRCTPEPGQNIELPIPGVGPMVGDDLSQAMEPKMNHQGQQKKLKCKPTTTNVPDELVLSSQQLVAEPQVAVTPPQLKPTIKELQHLRHMKLRSHNQCVSQSDLAVSMTESSPSQHQCGQKQEKEHHDELQNPKHQKQNPPRPKENVNPTMGVLFPSADGDKQQQKRGRGRPRKEKLVTAATCEESLPDKCRKQLEQPEKRTRRRHDVSLPDKCEKQLEQPEKKKRGRPCKLGVKMTVSRIKLTTKNQPREQKQGRGRPRKVTEEQPEKKKRGRPCKLRNLRKQLW